MSVLDLNDIDTLVVCGGGVHGIAYLSALETLYHQYGFESFPMGQRNPRITTIHGVSVGALIAFLWALGFDSFEEAHLVMDALIRSMIDGVHLMSFARDWGANDGKGIRSLLRARSSKRTGIDSPTFLELEKKTGVTIRIHATDLGSRKAKYFSPSETPNADVVDVVFASIAVPPLFAPCRMGDSLFVDGGLIESFPRIPNCNQPARCLVIRSVDSTGVEDTSDLFEPTDDSDKKISRVQDYISRIVECALQSRTSGDDERLKSDGLVGQTINIECGDIPWLSLVVDERTKKSLLLQGVLAAERFINSKDSVVRCCKTRSVGIQTDCLF